jgi:hypothetical protein
MANALIEVFEGSTLPEVEKTTLIDHFNGFFDQATEWEKKAKNIVITSVDQKAEMKMAREARLAMKALRVDTEKKRKALKEDSLRKSQTIDAIAKIITNTIIPIEEYLEEQEKFAENKEKERLDLLEMDRKIALAPYQVNTDFFDVRNMPDDQFEQLLTNSKENFEKAKKIKEEEEKKRIEEAKAEEERRKAIEIENEKLRKQKAIDDEKRAQERAAAEEKAKKLEAELKAANAEKERLKREAEEQERKEKEAKAAEEKRIADEKVEADRKEHLRLQAEHQEKERIKNLSTGNHLKMLTDYMDTIDFPQFPEDEEYTKIRNLAEQRVTEIKDKILIISHEKVS